MTAKQKANNLIDSYYVLLDGFITFEQVKICALISVDEIIKETMLHDLTPYEHSRTGYWLEVKQEIENL